MESHQGNVYTGFLGVQYYLMGNVPRHLMFSKV